MTYRQAVFLAAGGSLALLAGAFFFQAIGYAPCEMCLWQRWPHAVAVLIGAVALALPSRVLALAGALAALTTAALGVFHTGVEQGWWEGVTECASDAGLSDLSATDLLDPTREVGPPLVRCDEVAWEFLGLSMASWNALASLALAALWLYAASRSLR